jgi:hypothetical protein
MDKTAPYHQKLLASCLWQNASRQAALSELAVELNALVKLHNHDRLSEQQVDALLRSSDLFAEVKPNVWSVKS